LPNRASDELHPGEGSLFRDARALQRRPNDARKCRIRLITRGVDSSIPKLSGNLEEQSGLANLARASEELNSAWRWLADPF